MHRLLLLLLLTSPAWGASTTFVIEPHGHFPSTVGTTSVAGIANVMNCVDFIESIGITSATQIVLEVITAAGSTSSFTVYSAGGAAQVFTTGVQDWTTTGRKTYTGLSFSTVQGTQYRACWCTSTTTGALRGSTNVTTAGVIEGFHNQLATHMGTAANTCTAGSAPSSTGSLTTAVLQPPLWWAATATP